MKTRAASDLYTTEEAASYLRSNARTLARWRYAGHGPAFTKIGRRVAYQRASLDAFIQQQTRQRTAQSDGPKAA